MTDYRYERKFSLPCRTAQEVFPFLRCHPLRFREVYPQRTVNNIYFDSLDHDTYWMHVNGRSKRFKLRLRWYGALRGRTGQPALELKVKENHLGYKLRHELPAFDLDTPFSLEKLRGLCRDSGLDPQVQELVSQSRFSLLNRYDRRYFASADGVFRITLDTDLVFHGVDSFLNHRSLPSRLCPGTAAPVIMELKYDRAFDDRARKVTDNLPFRLDRMSKFVSGVRALHIH